MICPVAVLVRAQPFAVRKLFGICAEGELFDEFCGLFLSAEGAPERRHHAAEVHLNVLFIAAARDHRARDLAGEGAKIALREEGTVGEPEQDDGDAVLLLQIVGEQRLVPHGVREHIPGAPAERIPVRLAVSAVVVRRHRKAVAVEKGRERRIARGVFRHTVDDLHDGARRRRLPDMDGDGFLVKTFQRDHARPPAFPDHSTTPERRCQVPVFSGVSSTLPV